MKLCEQIKAPFESDEDLFKLIETYQEMKSKHNCNFFYSYLTCSPVSDGESQRYEDEYRERIVIPNCTVFYDYLKRIDPLKLDEYVERKLSKAKDEDQALDIKHCFLYPFKKYSEFLKEFDTFEKLYDFISEMDKHLFENHEKESQRRKSLPESERKYLDDVCMFFRLVKNRFLGEGGIAGFFVYPQLFVLHKYMEREKDEVKLYLNAGADTYKVAMIFKEKCEQLGYNYLFKVMAGDGFEQDKLDKMCIYSSLEDIHKFVEIIRQIIKEHPEIKFEKSSILCGYIDGVIGIGTDHLSDNDKVCHSYNHIMSDICYDVLRDFSAKIGTDDILSYINSNSTSLEALRIKIKEKVSELGLSYKVICLKDSDVEKIDAAQVSY